MNATMVASGTKAERKPLTHKPSV